MYCRNCGKELDNEAVVCPGCGVPVYSGEDKTEKRIKKILVLNIATYIICFLTLALSVVIYLSNAQTNDFVSKIDDALSTPTGAVFEEKDTTGLDLSALIGNLGE